MKYLLVAFVLLFSVPAKGADHVKIEAVLKDLPGVQDEGHLSTVAIAIGWAADFLTTCTPVNEEPCKPEWVWGRSELVASLITIGYWESRFLKRIGDHKCHPWECDAQKMKDGTVLHRAKGFYQVQFTGGVSQEDWRYMAGSKSPYAQRTAALVSGRILARNRHVCKTRTGMLAGYARGNGCTWSRAGVRALFVKRVLAKLDT